MIEFACEAILSWTFSFGRFLITVSISLFVIIVFIFSFWKFIYFNWRLRTLQYCSHSCHTLTWISHGSSCVPHPEPPPPSSPSHPSGLSQWTGFECPVSCIKLGLMISFTNGNLHVSMLFSQIIPPFLAFSHRVQKFVFYLCVSFAISHIWSSLSSF